MKKSKNKLTYIKKKFKKNNKEDDHIHIWDIPKKYFPRNTGAKEYVKDLIRITGGLRYTNQKIQYEAQICAFNIKSLNQKNGFIPLIPDTLRIIEEFVYHYENYCFRLFTYRERLLLFINAIIPIGYKDKQVKIEHILINPLVKQAKLLGLIEKFKNNTVLNKVIQDRNSLTHRLYYGIKFDHYFRPKTEREIKKPEEFKIWCDDWRKQIMSRSKLTNVCTKISFEINNTIARKIIDYKDSLKIK